MRFLQMREIKDFQVLFVVLFLFVAQAPVHQSDTKKEIGTERSCFAVQFSNNENSQCGPGCGQVRVRVRVWVIPS